MISKYEEETALHYSILIARLESSDDNSSLYSPLLSAAWRRLAVYTLVKD